MDATLTFLGEVTRNVQMNVQKSVNNEVREKE